MRPADLFLDLLFPFSAYLTTSVQTKLTEAGRWDPEDGLLFVQLFDRRTFYLVFYNAGLVHSCTCRGLRELSAMRAKLSYYPVWLTAGTWRKYDSTKNIYGRFP